jgi:citrate synthase
MSGNSSYIPGLEGVVASQTAISMVDGQNGRLVYQGYVIADLAEQMSFEEVAFLLWEGRLPTRSELDALSIELASHRNLTHPATIALEALPTDTDPMDVLRSVVSVQGVEHRLAKPTVPRCPSPSTPRRRSRRSWRCSTAARSASSVSSRGLTSAMPPTTCT